MKPFYKILGILIFSIVQTIGAQTILNSSSDPYLPFSPSLDSLINTVIKANKSLIAARELYQVNTLEARTGNAPSNPQVEMGYLFGNPSAIGNRLDFAVYQQFDFPTTYVHLARVRDIKLSAAELEYIIKRQNILFRTKQLWIERIFLNKQELLISHRLNQAEKVADHFQQRVSSGDIGQFSLNQSNLQTMALRSEYEQIRMMASSNQAELNEICGGIHIEIDDTIFPLPAEFMLDSIVQEYSNSPKMQLFRRNMELKSQQKKLTVSKNWPKLSAGYYSEAVLDTKFRGFQFGISIPLWENSNKIKQAKSEIVFAEADTQSFEALQNKEVSQLISQINSLQVQIESLQNGLDGINDEQLLSIALDAGEISFTEYLYATELYFRNVQTLFELKKNHLFREAELMKIYL